MADARRKPWRRSPSENASRRRHIVEKYYDKVGERADKCMAKSRIGAGARAMATSFVGDDGPAMK